jgi:hypothetical protein
MKKLLLIALLATSAPAFAKDECSTKTSDAVTTGQLVIDTKVPSHLKGAVIIVRRADGTESVVPAEKFKVVPRKQQIITTNTKTESVTQCTKETVVEKLVQTEALRNRLSIGVGKGPKGGLSTDREADKVSVETKTGAVGLLQYQRNLQSLDDKLNIGAQIQTNKSVLGTIGKDF